MEQAMRGERTRASMAFIMAPGHREKQPHDVSGGAREHRTMRRSGPVTRANMVVASNMNLIYRTV